MDLSGELHQFVSLSKNCNGDIMPDTPEQEYRKLSKTLIMIPTYNEVGNVAPMIKRLLALKLDADILFIDDNSPDGTGNILDKYAALYENIKVLHHTYKAGIGTAHQYGIEWAYNHCYIRLVTMDGDFTHSPEDIPKLLEYSDNYDIVIGGRHARKDSIEGWTLWRKFVTIGAHQFTTRLLRLPYDATTTFRIYRLDKIPSEIWWMVKSTGYSFFIESLCILNENKFTIYDVPVVFPPRAAGTSKLTIKDMVYWFFIVKKLALQIRTHHRKLYLPVQF